MVWGGRVHHVREVMATGVYSVFASGSRGPEKGALRWLSSPTPLYLTQGLSLLYGPGHIQSASSPPQLIFSGKIPHRPTPSCAWLRPYMLLNPSWQQRLITTTSLRQKYYLCLKTAIDRMYIALKFICWNINLHCDHIKKMTFGEGMVIRYWKWRPHKQDKCTFEKGPKIILYEPEKSFDLSSDFELLQL